MLPALSRILLPLLLLLAACTPQLDEPIPSVADPAVEPASRAESLRGMGGRALATGDTSTAVLLYHRAASLEPEASTLALYGNALIADGQLQNAVEAYREALRRDPADPAASLGFAKAMIGLGRADAAAAQLDSALRAHPGDIRLQLVSGVVDDMLGRHDSAQELYSGVLAREPTNIAAINNMALSLALSGQYDEAVRLLAPVGEGATANRRARQNLSVVYGLAGDFPSAERLARLDLPDGDVAYNMQALGAMRAAGGAAAAAALGAIAVEPSDIEDAPPAVAVDRADPPMPTPGSTGGADGAPRALTPPAPVGAAADGNMPAASRAAVSAASSPSGTFIARTGSPKPLAASAAPGAEAEGMAGASVNPSGAVLANDGWLPIPGEPPTVEQRAGPADEAGPVPVAVTGSVDEGTADPDATEAPGEPGAPHRLPGSADPAGPEAAADAGEPFLPPSVEDPARDLRPDMLKPEAVRMRREAARGGDRIVSLSRSVVPPPIPGQAVGRSSDAWPAEGPVGGHSILELPGA